jgi:hypothetical protein
MIYECKRRSELGHIQCRKKRNLLRAGFVTAVSLGAKSRGSVFGPNLNPSLISFEPNFQYFDLRSPSIDWQIKFSSQQGLQHHESHVLDVKCVRFPPHLDRLARAPPRPPPHSRPLPTQSVLHTHTQHLSQVTLTTRSNRCRQSRRS